MTRYLLDTNVLIALAWPQHIHHASAHAWFGSTGHKAWATCPITQLGFARISSNPKIISQAVNPRDAMAMVARIIALPGHEFWADDIVPATEALFSNLALVGHRQVTDGYLLALAKHRGGKLATFDHGLPNLAGTAAKHPQHVVLIDI